MSAPRCIRQQSRLRGGPTMSRSSSARYRQIRLQRHRRRTTPLVSSS